jgi:EpsI family protein
VGSILKNKFAIALTLALLAEGILYYSAYAIEIAPQNKALDLFATELGDWHMVRESRVDKETLDMLHADDTVNRSYAKETYPVPVGMFVAWFKTQRTGQSPHSPRNCLPGSGWEPLKEGFIDVAVPNQPSTIRVNRYIVARGDNASVVLYWYQAHKRVIASEYSAKIWAVLDSIRYHRSDTALVRVVVPVWSGNDAQATEAGLDFVKVMYPVLQAYLPS